MPLLILQESLQGNSGYSCEYCDYKSKWKHALKIHKESKHEGICSNCDECGYKVTTKGSLKTHKESKQVFVITVMNVVTRQEIKAI